MLLARQVPPIGGDTHRILYSRLREPFRGYEEMLLSLRAVHSSRHVLVSKRLIWA